MHGHVGRCDVGQSRLRIEANGLRWYETKAKEEITFPRAHQTRISLWPRFHVSKYNIPWPGGDSTWIPCKDQIRIRYQPHLRIAVPLNHSRGAENKATQLRKGLHFVNISVDAKGRHLCIDTLSIYAEHSTYISVIRSPQWLSPPTVKFHRMRIQKEKVSEEWNWKPGTRTNPTTMFHSLAPGLINPNCEMLFGFKFQLVWLRGHFGLCNWLN